MHRLARTSFRQVLDGLQFGIANGVFKRGVVPFIHFLHVHSLRREICLGAMILMSEYTSVITGRDVGTRTGNGYEAADIDFFFTCKRERRKSYRGDNLPNSLKKYTNKYISHNSVPDNAR